MRFGLFSDQYDLQGCCLARTFKETGGFKYAEAGRSLSARQGGKEKKGDQVRQAGMGGSFLPQMENFDKAVSKLLNDLIMSPNILATAPELGTHTFPRILSSANIQ